MAGLPGYAPKTLAAAQAQIHTIDQQQGFHAPVVIPSVDGPGFVAPGQGVGSAVRYDVATGYQGNDPTHPVSFATGAGMVQGGSGPVQGLPGVAVMPGVQRVGDTFSNTAPGLPAGVTQNGDSFTNLKQHLEAALTTHLQKATQNALTPKHIEGQIAETQLHQIQTTQQAEAAAHAAHLQALQQQAQSSPITTGFNSAIHDVGSGVLGALGGVASGVGGLTGWKAAQQLGNNMMGAAVQQGEKGQQQQAALSKATGLGSYVGAGVASLAPYLLGPEVAANTFAQNAALQGAQNGDSFGRNLAGAAIQGVAGIAPAPEAKMLSDALHGIAKNAVAKAAIKSAAFGGAAGAASGAGQSVTNDNTLAQGAKNALENAGIGTLLGGGAGVLTHGAASLAGKVFAPNELLPVAPEPAPAAPEAAPGTGLAAPEAAPGTGLTAQPAPDPIDTLKELLGKLSQPAPADATAAAEPIPAPNANAEADQLPDLVPGANGVLQKPENLGALQAKNTPTTTAGGGPGTGKTPTALLDQRTRPVPNTAAAVAPVTEAAADKAPTTPVVTPADVQGSNARAAALLGDNEQQVQAAVDSPSARVADAAKKVLKKGTLAQTEEPATQEQPTLDNLGAEAATPEQEAALAVQTPGAEPATADQFGASVMTPAHEKALSLLQNSEDQRAQVTDLATRLKAQSALFPQGTNKTDAANQVIHDLVNNGQASLGFKDTNGGSPFLVARTGQKSALAPMPLTHQAVLAHLEGQAKEQMKGRLVGLQATDPAAFAALKEKLGRNDFSGEPILNPTIHAPWMEKRLGITPGQAKTALDGLTASNEISPLDPELLAAGAAARGKSADDLNGYAINAQDPRLNRTIINNIVKDKAANKYEGWRQSELARLSDVLPDGSPEKALVQKTLGAFMPGGDAQNRAGPLNEAMDTNGDTVPKRPVTQLAEEQAPGAHAEPEPPRDPAAVEPEPPRDPAAVEEQASKAVSDIQDNIRKERAAIAPTDRHAARKQKALDEAAAWAEAHKAELHSVATAAAAHGVAPTPAMQKLVDFTDHILGKGRVPVALGPKEHALGFTDLRKITLTPQAFQYGHAHILAHEAAHVIRELYLTDAEKKMTDQALAPGSRRYEKLMAWGHKRGITDILKTQPYERFSYYAEAISKGELPKPTGILGRLYSKVLDHMDRLHGALHGAGYQNLDDVMQAMRDGQFGERGPVRSWEEGQHNLDSEMGSAGVLDSKAPPGVAPHNAQGVNYDIAGGEVPRSAPLAGVRKAIAGKAEQFEPLHTKALHNPHVRSVHELMVERGETARKIIAQAVHIAPHFLSPHVMDNLKGLVGHAKVDRALRDGDHFRQVFTDAELKQRDLNAKETALYHEYLAGREPGFQSMLGEDEEHHILHMAKLRESLGHLLKKHADDIATAQDPAADPEARAKAASTLQQVFEPILKDEADENERRQQYVSHIDRLRNEGYIPHSRTGSFTAHIQKWMPKSVKQEQELLAAQDHHTVQKSALEQQLGINSGESKSLYGNRATVLDPEKGLKGPDEQVQNLKDLMGHHEQLGKIKAQLAKIASARAKPDFEDPLVKLDDLSAPSFTSARDARKYIIKTLAANSPERAEAAKLKMTLKNGGVSHNDAPTGNTLTPKQIYDMLEGAKSVTGGTMDPEQALTLLRAAGAARSNAMKELASRKDIAGETSDLVHELSQFTGYHAHAYASAHVSSRLQTALHALSDPETGSPEDAEYVSKWLDGLNKAEVSKDPIMSKLRAAGMYMMLGGRLPAAAYTLGANAQMTMAHLARNENFASADARYAKALKDTALMTPKRLAKAVADNKGLGKLTPAETQSMYEAHLRGITDAQYAYLQDNANPHVKGASAMARLRRATATALMSPLGVTESRLRQATFLAALRQHADLMAQGHYPQMSALDHEGKQLTATDPFGYAREATKLSNQSFEPEDQAPIFNLANGDGKTLFMFQGPMLQMAYTLAHMVKTNPKLAAAALGGSTALGGVRALPMYALATALASGANQLSAAYGGPSTDNSPNAEIDKKLDEVHPGLANLAQHGIPDAIMQHFFGKTAPDIAPYFQIGSAGDSTATAILNTMIKAAGGTPAERAAPLPLISMLQGFTQSAAAIPDAVATGNATPVLRPGFGDTLLKSLYQAGHGVETGQHTNAEGSHPYAVTPGEVAENAAGLNSIRQNNMFSKIGQLAYRGGMRKLVSSRMNTLTTEAANDNSPAALKKALGIAQAWNKQNPEAAVVLSPQAFIEEERAAHENPYFAQLLKNMRQKYPMGLQTYGAGG